jgi:hypothetical protein
MSLNPDGIQNKNSMVQKEESLSKKHEMKVMSFISIKLSIDLMLLTMRKKYFLLGKNVT